MSHAQGKLYILAHYTQYRYINLHYITEKCITLQKCKYTLYAVSCLISYSLGCSFSLHFKLRCFSPSQVSPLESNVSESVCSLKFAQRVRTVEIGPSSSSRRQAENSSTSSSPTHDSVEVHSHNCTHSQASTSEKTSLRSE